MVQSCLLLRGDQENQSEGTSLPSRRGGLLIRCWHYIYICVYAHVYHLQDMGFFLGQVRQIFYRPSHFLLLNIHQLHRRWGRGLRHVSAWFLRSIGDGGTFSRTVLTVDGNGRLMLLRASFFWFQKVLFRRCIQTAPSERLGWLTFLHMCGQQMDL